MLARSDTPLLTKKPIIGFVNGLALSLKAPTNGGSKTPNKFVSTAVKTFIWFCRLESVVRGGGNRGRGGAIAPPNSVKTAPKYYYYDIYIYIYGIITHNPPVI